MENDSVVVNIRLRSDQVARIERLAKREYRSRSAQIALFIERALAELDAKTEPQAA